jgi:glycosyltransferase involved in cell wall biosynthesis
VEPGSVQQLANAIELLINDPAKRHRLAEEGYNTFQKRYRWQEIHRGYQKLIDSLSDAA